MKMRAIDMTPVIKKYPGYFVALTLDRKKVLAKGHSPQEVIKEAKKRGFKDPILTKIPEENRSYLL